MTIIVLAIVCYSLVGPLQPDSFPTSPSPARQLGVPTRRRPTARPMNNRLFYWAAPLPMHLTSVLNIDFTSRHVATQSRQNGEVNIDYHLRFPLSNKLQNAESFAVGWVTPSLAVLSWKYRHNLAQMSHKVWSRVSIHRPLFHRIHHTVGHDNDVAHPSRPLFVKCVKCLLTGNLPQKEKCQRHRRRS
jgi:hypothetical protein